MFSHSVVGQMWRTLWVMSHLCMPWSWRTLIFWAHAMDTGLTNSGGELNLCWNGKKLVLWPKEFILYFEVVKVEYHLAVHWLYLIIFNLKNRLISLYMYKKLCIIVCLVDFILVVQWVADASCFPNCRVPSPARGGHIFRSASFIVFNIVQKD